ncbi:hypothetical protein J4207_03925 [Candidatus Woesearchaeota archaeon]|nr:hypothetical protein [Candidatus Woesearchaeota archaeon]
MNKKAVELAFSKIIEILLFLIFLIVMFYVLATWKDQGYSILDRLRGLFR